jgi:hypothetical protein
MMTMEKAQRIIEVVVVGSQRNCPMRRTVIAPVDPKPAVPVGRGVGLAGARQRQQNEKNGCCSGGNLTHRRV